MADDALSFDQEYPSAGVLTALYAVPDLKQAAVSTLMVCNQGSTDAKFRVAIAPNAEADARKHYLYYDETVRANRSFAVTLGIALPARAVVRVQADTGLVSFTLFRDVVDA